MQVFKVSIIGESKCGKTTLVRSNLGMQFNETYVGTLGVEVHPLVFDTSKGNIILNVWDCGGSMENEQYVKEYMRASDCVIILHESTTSPSKLDKLISKVKRDVPIVMCETKSDDGDIDAPMFCSSKTNYNIQGPFKSAIKMLVGYDTIFM
jgi:GTP-binding nuclear protein Ran